MLNSLPFTYSPIVYCSFIIHSITPIPISHSYTFYMYILNSTTVHALPSRVYCSPKPLHFHIHKSIRVHLQRVYTLPTLSLNRSHTVCFSVLISLHTLTQASPASRRPTVPGWCRPRCLKAASRSSSVRSASSGSYPARNSSPPSSRPKWSWTWGRRYSCGPSCDQETVRFLKGN